MVDMMGMAPAATLAARKSAAAVPSLDLADEPGRRIPPGPAHADRSAVGLVGYDLDAGVAQLPAQRLARDHWITIDLGDTEVGVGVDDHCCPAGRSLTPYGAGGELDQVVGRPTLVGLEGPG